MINHQTTPTFLVGLFDLFSFASDTPASPFLAPPTSSIAFRIKHDNRRPTRLFRDIKRRRA